MINDPLRFLENLKKTGLGPEGYLRHLTAETDEVVRFAAWCGLVEKGLIRPQDFGTVQNLCRYSAMRTRAYAYFMRTLNEERAEEAARTPVVDPQPKIMLAVLKHDAAAHVEALKAQYFTDLRGAVLSEAGRFADEAEGWQGRAEWLCRAIAINPADELVIAILAWHLVEAGQRDAAARLSAILEPFPQYAHIRASIRADLAWAERRVDDCLAELARIESTPSTDGKPARLFASGLKLRALAREAKGDYRGAYADFAAMNRLDSPQFGDRTAFLRASDTFNAVPFPAGITPARRDHVMMLGFPRSGTTLLENALAMHPSIETFEEIASVDRAERRLEIDVLRQKEPAPLSVYNDIQATYYDEIWRRTRTDAPLKIDKTPMRTAKVGLLRGLFPGQRYIFSIRHPYDVVLSNFKQRFGPNAAMANFLTLADSVRAYEHVMTGWFNHFGLDDETVFYLRYDQLVTQFRDTMGNALDFLGLGWSDAVLDFAKGAEVRSSKTPSYTKVRSGLGIGVQTTWEHYLFAFSPDEMKILNKWCRFFGYEHA
jgi:hypothetical protein